MSVKRGLNHHSKDRTIVFIELFPHFVQFMPYLRKKGLSPILFTRVEDYNPGINPELREILHTYHFTKIYIVDTHNTEEMYSFLKKLKLDVAGIMAWRDDILLPAARLAKKLKLPNINITGLKNVYRKDKVRELLHKQNVLQPKYEAYEGFALKETTIPFPLVVKPIHDGGTSDVYFCENKKDYKNAITKIQSQEYTGLGGHRTGILIEEFIGGSFYAAELLWNKGKWHVLGFSDLFVNPKKSLCMTGMSFPADMPPKLFSSLKKEILKWVKLVGLKGGALCIEFKVYKNVPYLIEINPRLGGPNVNQLIQAHFGFSPFEYLIDEACGEEKKLSLPKRKSKIATANAFIFAHKAGVLSQIHTPRCDKNSDIKINEDFQKLPVRIDGHRNFGNVIGDVITTAKSSKQAIKKAMKIVKGVKLKIHKW